MDRFIGLISIFIAFIPFQANALLINGGFEEPVVDRPQYEYEHRSGFELTGWESFSSYQPQQGDDPGSVQFTSLYAPVSEGNQAVQLEWPGDWISQDFVTVTNQWYSLSFDLSAFFLGPATSTLGVEVGSLSTQVSGSASGYVSYAFDFLALSELSTLTFTNLGSTFTYPHIDNVVVSAVPEPEMIFLFFTGLIGFPLSRRLVK